jgi:hypothetical protein
VSVPVSPVGQADEPGWVVVLVTVTGAGHAMHEPVVLVIWFGPHAGVAVALAQVEYAVVSLMICPYCPALHVTSCIGPAFVPTVQQVPVETHDAWQVFDVGVIGP